jgi:hypothetical protein
MDFFFALLKKTLVATVFVIFAVVATYTPQSWNDIKEAHAGGLGGGWTEPTQIMNNVQLGAVNIAETASAAANQITSWATGSLWVKENILDGIGWAIAKQIVSSMVQSLINWINSGFQGSPAFLSDFKGFLLNAVDQVVGEYIQDLGGIGSFICSPFRLDVQISVALQYQQARADQGQGQPAPTCTLSGIINNIQGFIGGAFDQGGWDDWFDITASPQTYTPYGSVLSAQAGARARIINAKGEELTLLDWGDGFLSGEICNLVHGAGTSRQNCFISKPGKIIEEALSFNLDSGRQSLITADEINEIIAALLGQLANMAIQGVNGLLGLSGGTGYTYSGFSGGSYLSAMSQQSALLAGTSSAAQVIQSTLNVQISFNSLAVSYLPQLQAAATNPTLSPTVQAQASSAAAFAQQVITNTNNNIPTLTGFINTLNNPNSTQQQTNAVITGFSAMGNLYTQSTLNSTQNAWNSIVGAASVVGTPPPVTGTTTSTTIGFVTANPNWEGLRTSGTSVTPAPLPGSCVAQFAPIQNAANTSSVGSAYLMHRQLVSTTSISFATTTNVSTSVSTTSAGVIGTTPVVTAVTGTGLATTTTTYSTTTAISIVSGTTTATTTTAYATSTTVTQLISTIMVPTTGVGFNVTATATPQYTYLSNPAVMSLLAGGVNHTVIHTHVGASLSALGASPLSKSPSIIDYRTACILQNNMGITNHVVVDPTTMWSHTVPPTCGGGGFYERLYAAEVCEGYTIGLVSDQDINNLLSTISDPAQQASMDVEIESQLGTTFNTPQFLSFLNSAVGGPQPSYSNAVMNSCQTNLRAATGITLSQTTPAAYCAAQSY